jgi:hypothetical protein
MAEFETVVEHYGLGTVSDRMEPYRIFFVEFLKTPGNSGWKRRRSGSHPGRPRCWACHDPNRLRRDVQEERRPTRGRERRGDLSETWLIL